MTSLLARWEAGQPADAIERHPSREGVFALATYQLIEATENTPLDRVGRLSLMQYGDKEM